MDEPARRARGGARLLKYVSTRGGVSAIPFHEAILEGLAKDGGLYVPEKLPAMDLSRLDENAPLATFATEWLRNFVGEEDRLYADLPEICRAAFDFPIETVALDESLKVLELFHGPTAAFKDVGARFLAECVARLSPGKPKTVLVATSGDTGGAVAAAFVGRPDIEVLVLYPEGRISDRQEMQLTAWGRNVHAFAVNGSFDDCQRMAKEAFRSDRWSHKGLLSANSINLGRLVPQSIYYGRAALAHARRRGTPLTVVVPTGNLGNGVAAVLAKKCGAPLARIILACNANRGLTSFFETEIFSASPTVSTLANAMDVGDPSNLERLLHLYPGSALLRQELSASSATDDDIRAAIRAVFDQYGYVACPHTAAAFDAAKGVAGDRLIVATAHPAKFETIAEPSIGRAIEVPESLRALFSAPRMTVRIASNLSSLERAIGLS